MLNINYITDGDIAGALSVIGQKTQRMIYIIALAAGLKV